MPVICLLSALINTHIAPSTNYYYLFRYITFPGILRFPVRANSQFSRQQNTAVSRCVGWYWQTKEIAEISRVNENHKSFVPFKLKTEQFYVPSCIYDKLVQPVWRVTTTREIDGEERRAGGIKSIFKWETNEPSRKNETEVRREIKEVKWRGPKTRGRNKRGRIKTRIWTDRAKSETGKRSERGGKNICLKLRWERGDSAAAREFTELPFYIGSVLYK